MTALLSFPRQVLEGTLSRVDTAGGVLVTLEGVLARLTHATAPSAVQALPSTMEGMELASFTLGDPPKLELEVPLRSTNDLMLLLLARRGYRELDEEPMTAATFAALKNKQLDRTVTPARLVLRACAQDAPTQKLVLTFDSVDLVVRGLVATEAAIHRVKLGTVVHQDYSRDFVPVLGHAGLVEFIPQEGSAL